MRTDTGKPLEPRGTRQPIRTLLVDDFQVVLWHLIQFLEEQAFVRVVGTAVDGGDALDKAVQLRPDLVLMDVNMPRMSGLQATVLLRDRLPGTRIIIMTLDDPVTARAAAQAHGAHGFVAKARIVEDLIAEIRRVCGIGQGDGERGTT